MKAKQQVLCGYLIAAAISAGWTHGSAPVPNYANWKQVAEDIPCNKVEKDGGDVRVIGPFVVDGKTFEQHVIKDEKLVKEIDRRCSLKRG